MNYQTERHMNILNNLGFENLTNHKSGTGLGIVEAKKETDRGTIEVAWGDNGTARVIKPNGSVKWLYEKTDAQVRRALVQTIESNTYRRA